MDDINHADPKNYGLCEKEARDMRRAFIKERIADFHRRLYASRLTPEDRLDAELKALRFRLKVLREHMGARKYQMLLETNTESDLP